MTIEIITIGTTKQKYLIDAEADYISRLKHYGSVSMKNLKPPSPGKFTTNQIITREAEIIQKSVRPNAFIIALDRNGREFDSLQFSQYIEKCGLEGRRHLMFIIGGPYGLSDSVKKTADLCLSLSKMTFTHDLTRLLLLEQIYRAYTILRGENYHK